MKAGGRGRKKGLQSVGALLGSGGGDLRELLPSLPPPASPSAEEPLRSSILEPEELELLERGRKARKAVRERASELHEAKRRRRREVSQQLREQLDAQERAELKAAGRIGPCLPPYKRRNPRLYVQEEDLEDLLPDGWGAEPAFREDAKRLAHRLGFGRAFSVVLVLILTEWFHGLRSSARGTCRGTGGGGQLSPAWVGRKLGLEARTVKAAQARLDPLAEWRRETGKAKLRNLQLLAQSKPERALPKKPAGTVYLARYRVLKRYSLLTADLPPGERRARWMDRQEQLHEWVDLTGVYLPTFAGVRALRRRHGRAGTPPRGKRARIRARRAAMARARLAEKTGRCAVHGCGRALYRTTGLCRHHFRIRQRLPRPLELRRSPMQEDLYRRLRPLYRRIRARLASHPVPTITPNNVPRGVPLSVRAHGLGLPAHFNPPEETGPPRRRSAFRPQAPGAAGETVQPSSTPTGASSRALPLGCPVGEAGLPGEAEPARSGAPPPPRTLAEAEAAWGDQLEALRRTRNR